MRKKMSQKKSRKFPLEDLQQKAAEILNNAAAVLKLLDDLKEKIAKNSQVFQATQTELGAIQRMIKAWVDGRYAALPWKTLVIVVAAILYIVNPLDLFPDFLVGGLVDDLGLLTYVLARIKGDLDVFRDWEKNQSKK